MSPTLKFSTNTWQCAPARAPAPGLPAGDVAGDRALVAVGAEVVRGLGVSRPSASFRKGGPQVRVSSPLPGRSILITSAPRSARVCVHQGPASTRDRSSTRIPSRAVHAPLSGNRIIGRCPVSRGRRAVQHRAGRLQPDWVQPSSADWPSNDRAARRQAVVVFLAFAFAYFFAAVLRAITATLSPTLTQEFGLNARRPRPAGRRLLPRLRADPAAAGHLARPARAAQGDPAASSPRGGSAAAPSRWRTASGRCWPRACCAASASAPA
jgi:hypothetical protein